MDYPIPVTAVALLVNDRLVCTRVVNGHMSNISRSAYVDGLDKGQDRMEVHFQHLNLYADVSSPVGDAIVVEAVNHLHLDLVEGAPQESDIAILRWIASEGPIAPGALSHLREPYHMLVGAALSALDIDSVTQGVYLGYAVQAIVEDRLQ